jgi:hypothetical protein
MTLTQKQLRTLRHVLIKELAALRKPDVDLEYKTEVFELYDAVTIAGVEFSCKR